MVLNSLHYNLISPLPKKSNASHRKASHQCSLIHPLIPPLLTDYPRLMSSMLHVLLSSEGPGPEIPDFAATHLEPFEGKAAQIFIVLAVNILLLMPVAAAAILRPAAIVFNDGRSCSGKLCAWFTKMRINSSSWCDD